MTAALVAAYLGAIVAAGFDSVDGTVLVFDPTRPVGRWTAEATAEPSFRL